LGRSERAAARIDEHQVGLAAHERRDTLRIAGDLELALGESDGHARVTRSDLRQEQQRVLADRQRRHARDQRARSVAERAARQADDLRAARFAPVRRVDGERVFADDAPVRVAECVLGEHTSLEHEIGGAHHLFEFETHGGAGADRRSASDDD